ncbi:DNA polymerase zeta catalytic subunit isoform X1 [Maniola jurtina]|uniref:DNA polymerase zeta catalytic subunit isoform X1 n=1 Tax=Maniola jurtina TaxID=191418 RepID=UPI001E68F8A0|nr:DNA polymerase zeta catalytic subunit isoform X1 [Maniola jurtina]
MLGHPKDVKNNSTEKKIDTVSGLDVTNIKPEFSVRIVVCDHYLTRPLPGIDVIYSEFRGSDIKQVPVLRIFGPTPEGRKACLHIHGVFPYFYIPCPTPNPEPQFLYQIAASLDKALNIALKQATSANQHVYKITLVKGLPFYGFHDKEHLFLKIFLYNPGLIKQAVELCSNGAILGQSLQPHESHLNFTLQFFIDFNLFGMSNIDLQTVKFRKNGLSQYSDEPTKSFDDMSWGLKPESSCFYEADCTASHIINRQKVGKGDGIENPGLEEVWNQEIERRKQLNVSISSKSLSQGRIGVEETDTHSKFEKIMALKLLNLVDKPVDVNSLKELVHYPAETQDGSELLNATDISNHIQDSTINLSINTTLRRVQEESSYNMDDTVVNEDVALNSSFSLKYSQVFLDNDDLELVDILQDLDEQPVEDDSVMGTPANDDVNNETESDDAEYSQIFNDETVLLDPYACNKENNEESPTWNDSFWEGANIPQLDGTFDDDHVKKVRKRKMRPLKVGLSRPKGKKKIVLNKLSENHEFKTDKDKGNESESDEINVSQETIEDISSLHLKRTSNFNSPLKENSDMGIYGNTQDSEESISNPCQKVDNKPIVECILFKQDSELNLAKSVCDKQNKDIDAATLYDMNKDFEPVAGPSNINNVKNESMNFEYNYDSTPEEDVGIESFYDKSKIFDLSIEDRNNAENEYIEMESQSILESKSNILEVKTEQNFIQNFASDHKISKTTKILTPKIRPPTREFILSTLEKYSIPKTKNPEPFYSCHKDVGDKVEIGQMVIKLKSKLARDQKPFDKVLDVTSIEEWRQLLFLQTNEISEDTSKPDALKLLLASNRQCILRPLNRPPLRSEVVKWIENNENNSKAQELRDDNIEDIRVNIDELESSQAIGLNELNNTISLESTEKDKSDLNNTLQVTMQPDGSYLCFGSSEKNTENSFLTPTVETDFLTLMLLEVHTSVRGDLNPDPAFDQIKAVFLTVTNDCPPNHHLQRNVTEIFVVDSSKEIKYLDKCVFNYKISYADDEFVVFEKIVDFVKAHDPDIMCGYEIEMNSWGYVMERAQILGLEMIKEISRITEKNRQKRYRHDENELEGRVIGRITFNVWRLFRYELALSSYSFENCMYEVLKERVPSYSFAQLAEWWNDQSRILRWIPVEYYMTKLNGTVRMLDKLDIIHRTSELARLFGLQWWEVLSRGSQFRVESLMLRAARPLNLVALSPTVKQRAAMRAPECLPLIFEPESRFYTDPVIVLDFQSLYPSMMIAYNYCFSTCIGRVQNINGEAPYEFGAWRLRIPQTKLETLMNNGLVHWSPVGVGFVKSSVRRGVLPALLRRILAARQAVKKGMKLQTDEAVKKAMHSRQLGLKLIANVTYGYTAANFSGRMPCVEVGDSVVAKGRETLERAIRLVKNSQWNAKVVYGDTDSMFVQVPGGTRAEAFRIGQQIADAVTADNPSPVALKLEKVYQPCILQTKKRYVGYMYESPDQEKPVYEAKGIETVRRDGCPAGVKLLQRSLCALFETGDMSVVKRLVCGTLSKLTDGSLPPQELFFTREYHGPAGYRPGAAAPPNEIAKRLVSRDRRRAPRSGERVSWLVCAGAPGTPLVRLAHSPRELLRDVALSPHVAYYATRVLLPPLHRCLSLLGVDVFKWWQEIGWNREAQIERSNAAGGIARYMQRGRCAVCGARGSRALCAVCAARRQPSAALLAARLARADLHVHYCYQICKSCCGHPRHRECENTECPVLWRRVTALQKAQQIRDITTNLPPTYMEEGIDF